MNLQDQLNRDLKDAMRAKDQTRLLAIRAIRTAIIEKEKEGTGATSMKDMGRVMGEAMSALKGQADGNRVRVVVQDLLNA